VWLEPAVEFFGEDSLEPERTTPHKPTAIHVKETRRQPLGTVNQEILSDRLNLACTLGLVVA
jgi:hypothetical protein